MMMQFSLVFKLDWKYFIYNEDRVLLSTCYVSVWMGPILHLAWFEIAGIILSKVSRKPPKYNCYVVKMTWFIPDEASRKSPKHACLCWLQFGSQIWHVFIVLENKLDRADWLKNLLRGHCYNSTPKKKNLCHLNPIKLLSSIEQGYFPQGNWNL